MVCEVFILFGVLIVDGVLPAEGAVFLDSILEDLLLINDEVVGR